MVLMDTAAMADPHMRWMDPWSGPDVMSFPMDELRAWRSADAPSRGPDAGRHPPAIRRR